MREHREPAARTARGGERQQSPRPRPAWLIATAALALLGVTLFVAASAPSRSFGSGAVATPSPGAVAVSVESGPATESEPVAMSIQAPCIGDATVEPPATEACAEPDAGRDDHPAALDVPPWRDPDLPTEPSVTSAPESPGDSADDAEPVAKGGFVWPLAGVITSLFSEGHPLGIDIAAETGQGVGTVADGRVAVSAYDQGYGYYVLVHHDGGYATLYAHFMAPAEVNAGDLVSGGQVIGYAGSTGRSTGPHLHLEVRLYDRLIDPLDVLPEVQLVIDAGAYRAPAAPPAICPGTGSVPVQVPVGLEERCPEPVASSTPSPTPSPTPMPSPSPTPDPTPTPTATADPSPAPEDTAMGERTDSAAVAGGEVERTASPAPSPAQTATATSQPTPAALATPPPTTTASPTPTPPPPLTPAPVVTPSATSTPTPTPTASPTPSPPPAPTPTPTASPSPAPEPAGGVRDPERIWVDPERTAPPVSVEAPAIELPESVAPPEDAGPRLPDSAVGQAP